MRLVDQRGLEARAVERHPAQVGAAQRVTDGGRQAGLRKQVGKVQEHRHLLGDERFAMRDRRHLAHRVDGQVGRLALLAGLHVDEVQLKRRAQLFEQDERAGGAGVGGVVQG